MSDPTPMKKKDDIAYDPEDREIMKAIVSQRLREAQQRHYSQTLDYNIKSATKGGLAGAGISKTNLATFSDQLDRQTTEALANLTNAKTEVRILTEELRKLDNE